MLHHRHQRKCKPHPGRALVAGLAGGLIATIAMTAAQQAMRQAMSAMQDQEDDDSNQESQEDATTVKAADLVTWQVAGRHLAPHEKPMAGQAVHYGFGTLMGGIYGLMAEYLPLVRFADGLGFGAALFTAADEVAVPALGLSGSPLEQQPSIHVYALAAHLVYGGVCECTRCVVRRLLG